MQFGGHVHRIGALERGWSRPATTPRHPRSVLIYSTGRTISTRNCRKSTILEKFASRARIDASIAEPSSTLIKMTAASPDEAPLLGRKGWLHTTDDPCSCFVGRRRHNTVGTTRSVTSREGTPRHAATRRGTTRDAIPANGNTAHTWSWRRSSGRPEPAGGRLKSPGGSSSPWTLPIERRW